MADETLTPVESAPDVQAAPPPAPAAEDLSGLTPVDDTEKVIPGNHPPAVLSDLTPVEGTEKKIRVAPPAPQVQASGVIQAPPGGVSISARPDDFHTWLQDVQGDVKNGTSSTWVGAMLRKLGAKGTNYGVSEQTGDLMAGPVLGVPKALEGATEIGHEVKEGLTSSNMDVHKVIRGANKVIGGAMESLGPAALVAAPEGEALAVVVPAMIAQSNAQKAAIYMGADEDTAEAVGNVAGLYAGGKIHSSLHPVVERFGVAVNNRTAAEQEYNVRSRELETARGQAAEMSQRAIDAAQKETTGQATPADTDAARTAASEATKNVANAQKAFEQASKRRADATIEVEKLNRKISKSAEKTQAAEYEATTSEQKKGSDLFDKAVPSRGTNTFTPEDKDVAFAHLEEAKRNGTKIKNLPEAYEALEDARQGIEDKLNPYVEKYKNEPLTAKPEDSPKLRVAEKLNEMAKVDGNFADAMDSLGEFNITDPTVSEAKDLITKLNNYTRAAMKGANNWDIYNMIETNPSFAARFFMADELRDALHNNLEGHGVEGSRAARAETKSLVKVRDAVGAQMRANRGGTAVRGSGTQNKLRLLVGKLTGKAIKGAGIATGAELGGPAGAIAGGAAGEMVGEPVEGFLAPRDMTRDEHIEKAMKNRLTNRRPVEIKGGGTPAVIPTESIPPKPNVAPPSVKLAPRENTELHAELAAHFGESNLTDSTYAELEEQLREDVAAKNRNGQPLDPSEKTLITKILKADAVDKSAIQAAELAEPPVVAPETPKEVAKALQTKIEEIKAGTEKTDVNPALHALGRAEESGLVSHSAAMKAHSPAMVIPGLSEGLTSEDAHLHEWAHMAIGAVDGLEPVEIRSDIHPKTEKGDGAVAVFNGAALRDAAGNIDPEALGLQETQWLTQKMAGPASHEVFKGMTKDDVKASPATRHDFRTARAMVREVHPDFTPKQVEEVVDAAYERARGFLTKPHIADRVRANAAVREDGLSQTLHASHGRVTQFAEDIRNAHNEYTGTEPGPDSGGAGEGGEKAEKGPAEGEKKVGAGEGGRGEGTPKSAAKSAEAGGGTKLKGGISAAGVEASSKKATTEQKIQALRDNTSNLKDMLRSGKGSEEERSQALDRIEENNKMMESLREAPEESKILRKSQIPPEKTTGNEARDEAIRTGGGIPGGQFGELSMFHSPQTGSTLALPHGDVTPERVKAHIEASDKLFSPEQKIAPEESKIETAADNHEVLDNIKRAHGVHDDPKLENLAGFITPDARYIDLPNSIMHSDAIEDAGGAVAEGIKDNRPDFINETGTIRVHKSKERAGNVLAFSVPKGGVTAEQADAIARSFGANGDRNGVLRIERADVSPETSKTLSTEKDFPRASDVKPMLRRIKALEESKINTATDDQIEAHEKNGGSTFSPEGEDLAGKDLYAVAPYSERSQIVDKLTPEILSAYKEKNADLLKDGQHAVGTWQDPDSGKTYLDISKTMTDRDEAIKAGQDANQKAIYHLGSGETIPTGGTGEALTPEESSIKRGPKGSTVPLMENPLDVKGTGEKGKISTLDVAKALNQFSKKQNKALLPGEAEPKAMVDRAKKIAEDEAKYQLAQGKTGTEWYTTEMKDHDNVLQDMRPELKTGPDVDAVPGHPAKLSLFKAAEAVLSSGQKPYGNFKSAVKAWDAYNETGKFPRMNPATGKSWGPRGEAVYGNGLDMINRLIEEKGEKNAADWLLSEHPVSELKAYNKDLKGKKDDLRPGAIILGEKRGPFMQNLHGIESAFTADMWVSRTWNRWMGTIETGKNKEGVEEITSDSPRNGTERDLMKQSFEHTAKKLGLTTSSLQAVLWYYEQALYGAQGIPKESWSFRDAAKRAAEEEKATPESEQTSFNYGAREKGGFSNLANDENAAPGVRNAHQLLNMLENSKGWAKTGPTKAPGLIQPGNIDLTNRPVVKNDDGSHSSEYSISFEDNKGRNVLVPTVVNGKFLTPDGKKPKQGSPEEKAMFEKAKQHYYQTGEHMGIYDTWQNADKAAEQIHSRKLK